ncbi:hypothetical protein RPALISO_150 [Ruegeria phage RpAliso]|nr:hypothetical protein RPALISO_150 [Ruegeria phage RpAliso]
MPVITQKFIFRSDLRSNPDVKYLFGDNLKRVGLGGQAKEMRGEPNAIGVATKRAPGMRADDFFDDHDLRSLQKAIDEDLEPARAHLRGGGTIVIPEDGLGTGLSELPKRAPLVNKFLSDALIGLRKL